MKRLFVFLLLFLAHTVFADISLSEVAMSDYLISYVFIYYKNNICFRPYVNIDKDFQDFKFVLNGKYVYKIKGYVFEETQIPITEFKTLMGRNFDPNKEKPKTLNITAYSNLEKTKCFDDYIFVEE